MQSVPEVVFHHPSILLFQIWFSCIHVRLYIFFLQMSSRRPSSTDVNGEAEQPGDADVEGELWDSGWKSLNFQPERSLENLRGNRLAEFSETQSCLLKSADVYNAFFFSSQWTEIDRFPPPSSTTNTKWGKWSETETLLWWKSAWRGKPNFTWMARSFVKKIFHIWFRRNISTFSNRFCWQVDGSGVRLEDYRQSSLLWKGNATFYHSVRPTWTHSRTCYTTMEHLYHDCPSLVSEMSHIW